MTAQDNNARGHLGFVKAVANYIAPVLAEHEFTCTEATPYVVRFESPGVSMEVFQDRLSYEIEVAFGLKDDPSQHYNLRDMLDAATDTGHKESSFFQASKFDRIVVSIKGIAELLQQEGQGVLAGEPAVYRRMAEMARLRNEAYTKQVVQDPIRRAAEEAWQRRDYAKARDLYGSIAGDLTRAERKRLEYAQNH